MSLSSQTSVEETAISPSPHTLVQGVFTTAQVQPWRVWQVEEHPSVPMTFPSSQVSSGEMMIPSPQMGVHVSLVVGVPPEQVHVDKIDWQLAPHPFPSPAFWSSQVSGSFHFPFPQISHLFGSTPRSQYPLTSIVQVTSAHPSLLRAFPSSHSSSAAFTPSPHTFEQTLGVAVVQV